MDEAARQAAGRAVLRQMNRMKLNRADVIRISGVDNKTLQGLLKGHRWPHVSTQAKIESAIGWRPGDIERAARGELTDDLNEVRLAQSLSDAELIAELALRLGRRSAGTEDGDGHGQQPAPIVPIRPLPPTQQELDQGRAAAEDQDEGPVGGDI